MKRLVIIFLALVLQPEFLFAVQNLFTKPELKGYIKDLQASSFTNNADSLYTWNLVHNRINFKWNFTNSLLARVEVRTRLYYGEQIKLIQGFGDYIDTDEGYFKLSKLWVNKKAMVLHSTVDRLMMSYTHLKFTLTLGRQRINWGINTIWNPNDLFNASNFLDFDYEERPGTDGLRMQYFPNTNTSLEAGFKLGENSDQTVLAVLYKTNKWNYDIQLLTGIYYTDWVIGCGWAGNIKDAGFKGEFSYFIPKNESSEGNNVLSTSLTLDYSFNNNWYASLSTLYQSRVFISEGSAIIAQPRVLNAKFLMPYQYSFYANVNKQFSPLLTGNLGIVFSTTRNSTIFLPGLSFNISESMDLDLTAQCMFEKITEDYQTTGNTIYLRIKFSF